MYKSLWALPLLFVSLHTWAALTVTGVSGVSNYTVQTTANQAACTPTPTVPCPTVPAVPTLTGITIYGGFAGVDCDDNASNSSVCDSCPATEVLATNPLPGTCGNSAGTTFLGPLCACNKVRVYPALGLSIALSKNPANTGMFRVSATTGGTSTAPLVTKLGAFYQDHIVFQWSDICQAMKGTTCDQIASGTLTVTIFSDSNSDTTFTTGEDSFTATITFVNPGIDENIFETGEDGIGAFSAFPGDERIYFDELNTTNGSGWPQLTDGQPAQAIRVYISDQSLDKANPKEALMVKDLSVGTDGEPSPHYVDDLTNGTRYFFRIAVVDRAQNIQQFFPTFLASLSGTLTADCTAGSGTIDKCPYSAIPDEVFGMLTKDLNCFIASAAYGTTLEPKLTVFREFRYKVLLHSSWGKKFVLAYYTYGPYAARFISDKPMLRAVSRGFLWPLYGFSWLSIQYGFGKVLATTLILLAMVFTLSIFGIRRMRG